MNFGQKMLGIKRGLSLASRGEWPSDDEDDEDFELSGDEKESVLDIFNFPKIFAYMNLPWTMN